jgi:hypothetical protein
MQYNPIGRSIFLLMMIIGLLNFDVKFTFYVRDV